MNRLQQMSHVESWIQTRLNALSAAGLPVPNQQPKQPSLPWQKVETTVTTQATSATIQAAPQINKSVSTAVITNTSTTTSTASHHDVQQQKQQHTTQQPVAHMQPSAQASNNEPQPPVSSASQPPYTQTNYMQAPSHYMPYSYPPPPPAVNPYGLMYPPGYGVPPVVGYPPSIPPPPISQPNIPWSSAAAPPPPPPPSTQSGLFPPMTVSQQSNVTQTSAYQTQGSGENAFKVANKYPSRGRGRGSNVRGRGRGNNSGVSNFSTKTSQEGYTGGDGDFANQASFHQYSVDSNYSQSTGQNTRGGQQNRSDSRGGNRGRGNKTVGNFRPGNAETNQFQANNSGNVGQGPYSGNTIQETYGVQGHFGRGSRGKTQTEMSGSRGRGQARGGSGRGSQYGFGDGLHSQNQQNSARPWHNDNEKDFVKAKWDAARTNINENEDYSEYPEDEYYASYEEGDYSASTEKYDPFEGQSTIESEQYDPFEDYDPNSDSGNQPVISSSYYRGSAVRPAQALGRAGSQRGRGSKQSGRGRGRGGHEKPNAAKDFSLPGWLAKEIKQAKLNRRNAERTWMKSGLTEHKEIFTRHKLTFQRLIENAKEEYGYEHFEAGEVQDDEHHCSLWATDKYSKDEIGDTEQPFTAQHADYSRKVEPGLVKYVCPTKLKNVRRPGMTANTAGTDSSMPAEDWSRCAVCNIAFGDQELYETHCAGQLHKQKLKAQTMKKPEGQQGPKKKRKGKGWMLDSYRQQAQLAGMDMNIFESFMADNNYNCLAVQKHYGSLENFIQSHAMPGTPAAEQRMQRVQELERRMAEEGDEMGGHWPQSKQQKKIPSLLDLPMSDELPGENDAGGMLVPEMPTGCQMCNFYSENAQSMTSHFRSKVHCLRFIKEEVLFDTSAFCTKYPNNSFLYQGKMFEKGFGPPPANDPRKLQVYRCGLLSLGKCILCQIQVACNWNSWYNHIEGKKHCKNVFVTCRNMTRLQFLEKYPCLPLPTREQIEGAIRDVHLHYRLTGIEEIPASEGPLTVASFLPFKPHVDPQAQNEFKGNPLKRSSILEPPDDYLKEMRQLEEENRLLKMRIEEQKKARAASAVTAMTEIAKQTQLKLGLRADALLDLVNTAPAVRRPQVIDYHHTSEDEKRKQESSQIFSDANIWNYERKDTITSEELPYPKGPQSVDVDSFSYSSEEKFPSEGENDIANKEHGPADFKMDKSSTEVYNKELVRHLQEKYPRERIDSKEEVDHGKNKDLCLSPRSHSRDSSLRWENIRNFENKKEGNERSVDSPPDRDFSNKYTSQSKERFQSSRSLSEERKSDKNQCYSPNQSHDCDRCHSSKCFSCSKRQKTSRECSPGPNPSRVMEESISISAHETDSLPFKVSPHVKMLESPGMVPVLPKIAESRRSRSFSPKLKSHSPRSLSRRSISPRHQTRSPRRSISPRSLSRRSISSRHRTRSPRRSISPRSLSRKSISPRHRTRSPRRSISPRSLSRRSISSRHRTRSPRRSISPLFTHGSPSRRAIRRHSSPYRSRSRGRTQQRGFSPRRDSPRKRLSPMRYSPGRRFSPRRDSPGRRFSPRRDSSGRFSPRGDSPGRRFPPRRNSPGRRFSPKRDSMGRRSSPWRGSPGRFSPERNSPGRFSPRRNSPQRRISPRRWSPRRSMSPRQRFSPGRKFSPQRWRSRSRSVIRHSSRQRRSHSPGWQKHHESFHSDSCSNFTSSIERSLDRSLSPDRTQVAAIKSVHRQSLDGNNIDSDIYPPGTTPPREILKQNAPASISYTKEQKGRLEGRLKDKKHEKRREKDGIREYYNEKSNKWEIREVFNNDTNRWETASLLSSDSEDDDNLEKKQKLDMNTEKSAKKSNLDTCKQSTSKGKQSSSKEGNVIVSTTESILTKDIFDVTKSQIHENQIDATLCKEKQTLRRKSSENTHDIVTEKLRAERKKVKDSSKSDVISSITNRNTSDMGDIANDGKQKKDTKTGNKDVLDKISDINDRVVIKKNHSEQNVKSEVKTVKSCEYGSAKDLSIELKTDEECESPQKDYVDKRVVQAGILDDLAPVSPMEQLEVVIKNAPVTNIEQKQDVDIKIDKDKKDEGCDKSLPPSDLRHKLGQRLGTESSDLRKKIAIRRSSKDHQDRHPKPSVTKRLGPQRLHDQPKTSDVEIILKTDDLRNTLNKDDKIDNYRSHRISSDRTRRNEREYSALLEYEELRYDTSSSKNSFTSDIDDDGWGWRSRSRSPRRRSPLPFRRSPSPRYHGSRRTARPAPRVTRRSSKAERTPPPREVRPSMRTERSPYREIRVERSPLMSRSPPRLERSPHRSRRSPHVIRRSPPRMKSPARMERSPTRGTRRPRSRSWSQESLERREHNAAVRLVDDAFGHKPSQNEVDEALDIFASKLNHFLDALCEMAGADPVLSLRDLHPSQQAPVQFLMQLSGVVDVGTCLHALQILASTDPNAVSVLTSLQEATVQSLLRQRHESYAGLLPHVLVHGIVTGQYVDSHAFQVLFQQRKLDRDRR